MYIVQFAFNKIERLHSVAYYLIKNSTKDVFWKCSTKDVFSKWSLFFNVTGLQFRIPSLTKNTPRKIFPESVLNT